MILIYRFLTVFFYPFIVLIIIFRKFINKEDKERYKEKLFPSHFLPIKRNKKKLIWFHAASIGEVQSIFPLIEKLNIDKKNLDFLITTVTLSSGNLVTEKFKNIKNVHHRYFPVDVIYLVKNFLECWKPNLVLFVDSEIWPNFLLEINKRKIKSIILNGRITEKSFNRWIIFPRSAKKIFNSFNLCLAASKESQKFFKKLNVKNLKFKGNLKISIEIQKNIKDKNLTAFNKKKIWCAASTHKGEELMCLKTHIILKKSLKNLMTVIIPRHINRSGEIKKLCDQLKLNSQILKHKDLIKKNKDVIIVNSFGLLPKYFSYSKSVFMGKSTLPSLRKISGQNPIEAVKMGCKIYHGPFVKNFKEIYQLLKSYKISQKINDEKSLAKRLLLDLNKNITSKKLISKKITFLGETILNNTVLEVKKFLR